MIWGLTNLPSVSLARRGSTAVHGGGGRRAAGKQTRRRERATWRAGEAVSSPATSSTSAPFRRLPNFSAVPRFLRTSFLPSFLRSPRIRLPILRYSPPSMEMEQAPGSGPLPPPPAPERDMGFAERAVAAAGAAVVSAVLVNPLDVAKTRLQAQAAGVVYNPDIYSVPMFSRKKGGGVTFEVFSSGNQTVSFLFQRYGQILGAIHHAALVESMVLARPAVLSVFSTEELWMCSLKSLGRQEGIFRLWRGTGASLALAVPTVGIYLPCYDLLRNWIEEYSDHDCPKLRPYAPFISGSISRSLACITCSPIELARTRMQAFKGSNVGGKPPGMWKTLLGVLSSRQSISSPENFRGYHLLWTGLGAQLARDVPFSAICWTVLEPKDPERVLSMNTRRILLEVWRNEGMSGLFRGAGPRMGRAGPSVGIVVSSYEVVKHIMHRKHAEL
ncbi:hypothetical protein U9M48_021276 [Paspalum notatum var. saurae]|uniref:Mitochondrial carrier protein n=1 Tax=Paspalum notatum var. saurae TaxID=547442 RepID=A0AAQ3TK31_PASNO